MLLGHTAMVNNCLISSETCAECTWELYLLYLHNLSMRKYTCLPHGAMFRGLKDSWWPHQTRELWPCMSPEWSHNRKSSTLGSWPLDKGTHHLGYKIKLCYCSLFYILFFYSGWWGWCTYVSIFYIQVAESVKNLFKNAFQIFLINSFNFYLSSNST